MKGKIDSQKLLTTTSLDKLESAISQKKDCRNANANDYNRELSLQVKSSTCHQPMLVRLRRKRTAMRVIMAQETNARIEARSKLCLLATSLNWSTSRFSQMTLTKKVLSQSWVAGTKVALVGRNPWRTNPLTKMKKKLIMTTSRTAVLARRSFRCGDAIWV